MEVLTTKGSAILRLTLLVVLMLVAAVSVGQTAEEYEVKAAFLYNFTKFVEWPQAADSPSFWICILGDDPFESAIDKLTAGKTASGRPIQVRRLKDAIEGKQCRIVFVGASERGKASRLVDATRGTAVLTVGESNEFLRAGGMIFLSMERDRVSVVINPVATQAAGLKVSAKLMTLAKVYKP